MSDYVDRVLMAAERTLGTPDIARAVAEPEEAPGVAPTTLAAAEPPEAAPRRRREDPPESLPRPSEHRRVRPPAVDDPATTEHARELSTDDEPVPVARRRDDPIASAHIQSDVERPATNIRRAVSRNHVPCPLPMPAPSWSGAWMDVPEVTPRRGQNRRGSRPATQESDDATAAVGQSREKTLETARSMVAPEPSPAPSGQPAPTATHVSRSQAVVAAPPHTSTLPPSHGLVIHNLEIRVIAPEPERPVPEPPLEAQKSDTPAGAWTSPARRYAGRG
jgi:hypothetical protein